MTTFFEYAALGILCMCIIMVVYGFVYLHGIPHHIAEKNDHPHKRAIHVACWLSVFTLHAIWPFVFLWALYPRTRMPVVLEQAPDDKLLARIAELEQRVTSLAAQSRAVSPTAETSIAQTVKV